MGRDIRVRVDELNSFISRFDKRTGLYVRSGVLKDLGGGRYIDTGVDPFMSSYPELIDVGIMGHCVHGKLGLCKQSGVECYQSGDTVDKPNMSLDDYKRIVDESKDDVYQIALGGAGDPNKHENFREILEYTRLNGIVPNYTTSGLGLTDEEVELTAEYCGAVAVSWYRSKYTREALKRFIGSGCITNVHYVLGNNSIDEAICLLRDGGLPEGLHAIVFLLHKPVGLGSQKNVLDMGDSRVKEFFRLVDEGDYTFKIGFDSCSVPGILNMMDNIDLNSIDTCEGARWSMYITSGMVALPCSFDNDKKRWGYDLAGSSIREAWVSKVFDDFRSSFKTSCGGCSMRAECMGGCPIVPEIVLCDSEYKSKE